MIMLLNHEQIKDIIPHRYPFLLVDSIEVIDEIDGKKHILGKKCVSANEPFFQGHFPSKAVMPGVLVLEALAQVGAVMVLSMPEYKGKIAFFAGADNVKWKRQVVPGDVITLELTEDKIRHGIGRGFAKATVDGQIVCTAELTFAIGN
ncbi:MAG: 3-hydroxyacyl-ACP dehydratase FabZ [Anaeroplasma sp.]